MLKPVLVTPPAVRPLTIDDVKRQCNIDHSDDDAYLDALINVAVDKVDAYRGLGQALISQTWAHTLSGFCSRIRLPLGPLITVSSVEYYDTANALQTVAGTVYAALTDSEGPYIALLDGKQWPSVYSRADAVKITYTAGFGATANDVPAPIRHAMLMMIGHWYQNREAVASDGPVSEMPMAVATLLESFNRVGV